MKIDRTNADRYLSAEEQLKERERISTPIA